MKARRWSSTTLVLVAVALVALVAYNTLSDRVSTFVNGITF